MAGEFCTVHAGDALKLEDTVRALSLPRRQTQTHPPTQDEKEQSVHVIYR